MEYKNLDEPPSLAPSFLAFHRLSSGLWAAEHTYHSAKCSIILSSQNNKYLLRRVMVSEHIPYGAEKKRLKKRGSKRQVTTARDSVSCRNLKCLSLCIALKLSYSVGQRWNRERGVSAPDISLGVQRLCSARIGIWDTANMSGGSAKRFSIENPGACPRRARDGWVGTSRSVVPLDGPAPLSSTRYLGSGGWVKINRKLNA